MAETKLKGVIELTAKPIKVDEAAAKLKDSVQEAFRAGGAGGLSDAAGSAGTHLSGIMPYGKTAASGLSGAAQNLKGLLSGALGAAESGTKSGLIASAGGLIEGLGVAALGGAGMAVLGMVATIGFIKALANASHGLQEFNYKLGGDVGAMAVVKGILDLQNTMLQLQVGSKLAPSAMKSGEAAFQLESDIENALVPVIRELNLDMAKLLTGLIPLVPAMVTVAEWIAKFLGHTMNVVKNTADGVAGLPPPSAKTSLWTQAEYGFGQGLTNMFKYGGWEGPSNILKAAGQYNFSQWPWDQHAVKSAHPVLPHPTAVPHIPPSPQARVTPPQANPASGTSSAEWKYISHQLRNNYVDNQGKPIVTKTQVAEIHSEWNNGVSKEDKPGTVGAIIHSLMGNWNAAHAAKPNPVVPGVGVHPLAQHAAAAHPTVGSAKQKQQSASAEKLLGNIAKGIDHLNTKAEKTNNFLQQLTPEERGSAMGFLTFMNRLAEVHPGKGHKADRQQLWEDKFDKKVQAKIKSGVHTLANPGWMKVPKKSPHTLKGYVNPDGAA